VARTIRPSFRVISVTPCRTDATRIAGGDAIVNEKGWTYPKVMLLNTYIICPKISRRQSSLTMTPRRRSNANWCYVWRRCSGAYAARRRSKPPFSVFRRMARNHCRLPGVFGSWCARAFDHGKTTDTNGSDDDPDLRPFDRSDQIPDPARVLSLCF
jgi:hypothetical protein